MQDTEIIVTAVRSDKGVAGIVAPDTAKAKGVLTQEFIRRQSPGQTINEIVNQLPGVSFQNNDPYGSGGGKLTIRGFDSSRISQTFDGIPVNDSGSYSIFTNQQLDPELIEQVNVNFGTTDVDSPTAAASGSTVNYRTRQPTKDFRLRVQASAGRFDFRRFFGVVDSGNLNDNGLRAFLSASRATNDAVFGGIGRIAKTQINGRVYQPLAGGDFISIAGHYNRNRNSFFGAVPLRFDTVQSPGGVVPRMVGPDAANRFPLTRAERFYVNAPCTVSPATPGMADDANRCGSSFDYRLNPSDTGNIRVNSRFTLNDRITLFVDPSFQFTKANGGGTAIAEEGLFAIGGSPVPAYVNGTPYFGRDINGDGDALDMVRVQAPSQSETHRYGLIASLRYDFNEQQTVRVGYSLDYALNRQTGEVGLLTASGRETAFPVDHPQRDGAGNIIEKRDRRSKAILHQISGEYRGEFIDGKLVATAGVRAPFFRRDLDQRCFTTSATGSLACFATASARTGFAVANPAVQPPQKRVFRYDRILPNLGLTYDLSSRSSLFASYSKGVQVPGTDNLYNGFFFGRTVDEANPRPETTDNFDLGLRYRSRRIQAQFSGWYTVYQNRLASAFDRDLNTTVYRNLGKVTKYGVDGLFSYSPVPEVALSAFGSYLKSKIADNVQTGGPANYDCSAASRANPTDIANCAFTAGKRESGAPVFTLGGRIDGRWGPMELGLQAKRTGPRYVNDQNLPVMQSGPGGVPFQVYGAKAPAYTVVDLDLRIALDWAGLNDRTYFQFNVTNLFDTLHVGGFDGNLPTDTITFANIGAPRTIVGTLVLGF